MGVAAAAVAGQERLRGRTLLASWKRVVDAGQGCSIEANLQLPLYRSVSVVCDVGRGMDAAIDGLDWRESAHVEEIQDSETSAHEHQDSDGDASVPQGGARSQAARKSAEEVTGDRPRDPLRPP
jgi:hypothetical protein